MLRHSSALIALALLVGCGSKPSERDAPLTFQNLDTQDTAGLSAGPALLGEFEVERDPAGALRARGQVALPEGTRLELIVYSARGAEVMARTQFAVRGGGFESPPVMGPGGRLPEATYHFQLRAQFDPSIQPAEVMAATDDGMALRGPGMIRGAGGLVAFVHDRNLRR